MSKYNIKIIDQKVEIEGDSKDEYEVRTKDGKEQAVTFEEHKKDESESKEEIALQYRVKKSGESKFGDWQDFTSKVKWNGGWIANGIKLSEKSLGSSGATMKKELEPGLGFFKTPTITCWIGIAVIVVAVIALIWWWIASSNKEDKEEESL